MALQTILGTPLGVGALSVLLLLVVASVAAIRLRGIRQRVATWWGLAGLLGAAFALGRHATVALLAVLSFMALREYLSLAPTRREDRPALLVAFATVPAAYLLIANDLYGTFLVAIPVYAFLAMPAVMVLNGRTKGYLAAAGIVNFGLVLTVYNIAHAALFLNVPDSEAPAGGFGLLFFLLVATALNDVFQYVAGRLIGGPKIVPRVSPNKTVAGFLGGLLATGVLVFFLAPVFMGLGPGASVLLALALPIAGFAGDVTMSAVKRDLGVKDSAKLLPGHGGILDRVDSLTFTAPITFHIYAFFVSERF